MEVKAGYKHTEVGVIPEDWEVTTLAKVSRMKSGDSITGADIDQFSEYPCYGGNGLRGFTSRFTHDGNYALIGRQGALCGNVLGVSGKFFASEHAVVVTPFEQTAIQWLTYVLEDMNLNQYSESSAQPGLSVAKILNLALAVPPTKAEQEAIAEALSDADALIEALEGLIAKKRQVKQGALQELLNGKKRLPTLEKKQGYRKTEVGIIPEDWQVMTLAKVCRMKSGESITGNDIDQFAEYPCYGGNGLRGFTNRFTHDGQYALIGRQGALCGNVLGVSGKFFASEHAVVVTPFEQTDIHWLTYVLEDMNLNQYSESSAQPGLSVAKILN